MTDRDANAYARTIPEARSTVSAAVSIVIDRIAAVSETSAVVAIIRARGLVPTVVATTVLVIHLNSYGFIAITLHLILTHLVNALLLLELLPVLLLTSHLDALLHYRLLVILTLPSSVYTRLHVVIAWGPVRNPVASVILRPVIIIERSAIVLS